MARSVSARALAGVAILVTVTACGPTAAGSLPAPTPGASAAAAAVTPSPTPSVTPEPGYGSAPPAWPTDAPFTPASPLPDPSGDPVPDDMIGREYNTNPVSVLGTQALVLTLRAAGDAHCSALYDGRSTCFTILWTPNYPKANDPAVRGSARIVDGKLDLAFDLVPYDQSCEGTTSTYTMSADGWTLEGVDVPYCSFRGFTRH